jgi:hypothetical protein
MYSYVTGAIMGDDGIINRIKHNILDDIFLIIQALLMDDIPDAVIEQLEGYVNYRLSLFIPAFKQVFFEILYSDAVAESVGCCGLRKQDRKELIMAIVRMFSSASGRLIGPGFEQGVLEAADVVFRAIDERNARN